MYGHCECLNRDYIWKLLIPEAWIYLDIVNALAVVITRHNLPLNRGYIRTLLMHEPWFYLDIANA